MEVDSVASKAQQINTGAQNSPPEEEDLYLKMKELQNKLEMIEIQEEYIKTELNHLKSEEMRSKDEVSNYRQTDIYETMLITKVFCSTFYRFSEFKAFTCLQVTLSKWLIRTTQSSVARWVVDLSSMCVSFQHWIASS